MEQTQEGLRLRQILTDYFETCQEIQLARLFGSVAQGRETSRSDVDVAIHGREPLGVEQLVALRQDLECLCGRAVDLWDLRAAEGLFLYKIMTKGCTLKHQPEIHHHYVMKALCFYEDFYPLVRRMQLERVESQRIVSLEDLQQLLIIHLTQFGQKVQYQTQQSYH